MYDGRSIFIPKIKTMIDALKSFKSIIEISVAWGEMDAANHVNNTVYLRYGESSRIAYLQACGFDFDLNGQGVILAEINCKYKFPLTFPDTVFVGTRAILDSMDDFGFWTEQIIYSKKYDRISAVLQAKLIHYDFQALKKVALSEDKKQQITGFENQI
jgi:acyl-CoA thioester hydrolase